VTYVDCDLYFFDDPRVILAELGAGSILLLPHHFPPDRPVWTAGDGIFNGGWITFRRDARSFAALAWWRDRCLEWCHDRRENGKYADQHYLDDWPERFDGVRVIANPGAGLAPWNGFRHRLDLEDGLPAVNVRRAVFSPYQSPRLVGPSGGVRRWALLPPGSRLIPGSATQLWWTAPDYELSDHEIQVFWVPYLRRLIGPLDELRTADPAF